MNLLHYNSCKSPTCFGYLLWPSSGRCLFFRNIYYKENQANVQLKHINFKDVIYNICYSAACSHNTTTLLGWRYNTHSI